MKGPTYYTNKCNFCLCDVKCNNAKKKKGFMNQNSSLALLPWVLYGPEILRSLLPDIFENSTVFD